MQEYEKLFAVPAENDAPHDHDLESFSLRAVYKRLQQLRNRAGDLSCESRGYSIYSPISSSCLQLASNIAGVLASAMSTLEQLQMWCDDGGDSGTDPDHCTRLGDICFAARQDLFQVTRELKLHYGIGIDEDIVLSCDRVRRRLRKAIGAVMHALDDRGDTEGFAKAELETALAIRTLYSQYRTRVITGVECSEANVAELIHDVSKAVSTLMESEVFNDVRLADKRAFSVWQSRIVDWLAGRRDPGAGIELHRDLVAGAELLRQINKREELQAHDRQLIVDIADILNTANPTPKELGPHLPRLTRLRGCDEELDAMLEVNEFAGQIYGRLDDLKNVVARLRSERTVEQQL